MLKTIVKHTRQCESADAHLGETAGGANEVSKAGTGET